MTEFLAYGANAKEVKEIGFITVKIWTRIYDVLGYEPKTKKKMVRLRNRYSKEEITTKFPLKVWSPDKNLITCNI